MLENLFLESGS